MINCQKLQFWSKHKKSYVIAETIDVAYMKMNKGAGFEQREHKLWKEKHEIIWKLNRKWVNTYYPGENQVILGHLRTGHIRLDLSLAPTETVNPLHT